MLNHRDIGKAGYLHNLCEVLKSIGQEGDAVIVGRGARYILPEQFGLRVRLVAPRDIRIRCIEKELGATREEARFIVNESDRDQAAFMRHHFHADVNNPQDHDLVINTGHLTPEAVAEIVLKALEKKLVSSSSRK